MKTAEAGCEMCSRFIKKTYDYLKRHYQDVSQLFLVHFWEEWYSGIERYTQNRKAPSSNATNTLGQTLGRNLITRLPVNWIELNILFMVSLKIQ